MISDRQRPVVDALSKVLSDALAIAAAISDNADEELIPIPREQILAYCHELDRIKFNISSAGAKQDC